MKIEPIKTRIINPPKDDLLKVLEESLPKVILEKSIVAVTSKVVSIWEGKCIHQDEVPDKDELIKKESDLWLSREHVPNGWVMHTLTKGMLMPTAGIDKSNSGDYYVLLPDNSNLSAEKIRDWIKEKYNLKDVGVLITDSRSLPLRRGTIGVAIGWAGFNPLNDYRDNEDVFKRKLVVAMTNAADSLATASVFTMGEGDESTPIALITDVSSNIQFGDNIKTDKPFSSFVIPKDEDIYSPFLNNVPWNKGK